MTPQERYNRDPQFRTLVDMLTHQIIECRYSPTELREAAILAVIRHETIHARPTFLLQGKSLTRVDSYHGREESNPQIEADSIEKRVSDIERWIESREDYEREQGELA